MVNQTPLFIITSKQAGEKSAKMKKESLLAD